MKKLQYILALLLSTSAASAEGTCLAKDTQGVCIQREVTPPIIAEEVAVLEQSVDDVVTIVESSWRCDVLGTELKPGYTGTSDKSDAQTLAMCYGGPNGNIVAMPSGPNFGLMERLEKVGFPTEKWRKTLSDPENLLRFQKEWEVPLHALVMTATYAPHREKKDAPGGRATFYYDDGKLGAWPKIWARRFIERRMSEAKVSDRQEIARIWGEIIVKQLELYEKDRLQAMPEMFQEQDPAASVATVPTAP